MASASRIRTIIPIRDLNNNHIDKKVNLIGFVLEFSFPRKSSGTDYVSILKIVDESQQNPELSVHLFTENFNELPRIKSQDLIVLNNVMIKKHEGELFAIFNKKFSNFGLFDGEETNDFTAYQAYGAFALSWSARTFISNLRSWWSNYKLNSGRIAYILSMKDLSEWTYFDLVCKVLHVSYDVNKGLWMLFVWDGTDVPPLSLRGKLKDEDNYPLPLQVESVPLDPAALSRFHCLGTVLRILADQVHENLGSLSQVVGKWAIIRNMSCQASAGMWRGCLNSSSRVRLLSDDDDIVNDYRRNFKQRAIQFDRLPLWNTTNNSLTVIDHNETQFFTLMDMITNEKDDEMFCCVVRVIAICPSQTKDFDRLNDSTMRLTLEDPTSRIHAHLWHEDRVKFFNNHTPDELSAKLKRLLGVPEHQNLEDDCDFTRCPPWIKCCIYSTRVDGAPRDRVFHVCNTRLV